ncbi:MAG: hypothetical protein KY466_12255 [Gemmatimonadetes bacterium]|nr:hypothetical protein [Gemmatimonadota bacterium]
MRGWRGFVLGALLVFAAPVAAAAQARVCDLVQAADYAQITNASGESVWYFRDPVRLRCTGNVTLAADSAVYNRSQGEMELIGAVAYRDSANQLTADWANYVGRLEQLLARGNVVLTDLRDGSVVTGQELQYLREMPTRPLSQVVMRGGRPRAVLREARPQPSGRAPAVPPPAADTAAPVEITADRLEFLGDSLFLARGRVEIERGATTGASDSARYDQPSERLTLLGRAHVRDDRYRLEGERIDAFVRGEVLREVRAEVRTSLVSAELTVRSERLRIGFVEGALDRLEAWNPLAMAAPRDSAAPPAERAVALAEDFRLRADSIDAIADSGRIREVRAIGHGYGERRLDSLAVDVPAMVARDWIQGDTIIGYFADVSRAMPEDSAVDGAAPSDDFADPSRIRGPEGAQAESGDSVEVVLERVVVIGGSSPALSLYRMEPGADGERGAINFMKARRIILFMTEGDVDRVEADGPMDGVYLDPVNVRRTPAPAAPPTAAGGRDR